MAIDERRATVVTMRSDGYVEDLFVNTTGQVVHAGDRLFRVYSPDIQLAVADLLVAKNWTGTAATGMAKSLDGAMQRLRNLGVPEARIREIRDGDNNPRTIDWLAPADGTVVVKNIVNGQRVSAGDELYRIVDLNRLWVIAEVAEGDLAEIKLGDRATVTFRAYRSEPVEGAVTFIYPQVTTATRTVQVRIDVANPDAKLKPDMYADVVFHADGDRGAVTTVPVSAVIDSGSKQVVLVAKGEGRFEPRAVKLGRRGDGHVEIVEGLKEGDEIVTSATFLIDAESNLQVGAQDLQPNRRARNDRAPSSAGRRAICSWSASRRCSSRWPASMPCRSVPLDAIPDLSDVQVIVYTEYPGQAPQVVEDQVTYPLTTAHADACRSRRWCAASRSSASPSSMSSSRTAPTSTGRARACSNISTSPRSACRPASRHASDRTRPASAGSINMSCAARKTNLAELRSDPGLVHALRLAKAEGVAEVASVGGFVKQYQVVVDPRRLQALRHSARQGARRDPRAATCDVGGRTIELSETEFIVRGRGYLQGLDDLEQIVRQDRPAARRFCCAMSRASSSDPTSGAASPRLNGEGEVVSGIVAAALRRRMRSTSSTTSRQRLAEIAPSLPQGREHRTGL